MIQLKAESLALETIPNEANNARVNTWSQFPADDK